MPARPISVTILAWVLILAGAVGLVYHIAELDIGHPFANDGLLVEFVRLLAVISGVFMLRGANWARCLAIAWITVHVILSFWHSWEQLAMHCVVFLVFAFFLFRPPANTYFRGGGTPR